MLAKGRDTVTGHRFPVGTPFIAPVAQMAGGLCIADANHAGRRSMAVRVHPQARERLHERGTAEAEAERISTGAQGAHFPATLLPEGGCSRDRGGTLVREAWAEKRS